MHQWLVQLYKHVIFNLLFYRMAVLNADSHFK
uniref:Uncharacterized protein n=1 Tax=Arundo donax TaxID=35708 RepID=A0A0A8ZA05_ARUDO